MNAAATRPARQVGDRCRQQGPIPSAGYRQESIVRNPLQFILGTILLAAGLGFYYLFRASPIALFEHFGIEPATLPIALAHDLINSLPSFIHIVALSLLLGSLIRPGYLRYLGVCLFWLLIDSVFEIAQAFGTAALTVLPEKLRATPLVETIHDYLRFGVYDGNDMIAIVIGACLAYGLLVWTGIWLGGKSARSND